MRFDDLNVLLRRIREQATMPKMSKVVSYSYSLRQLEARFVKRIDNSRTQVVELLHDADGVDMLCPRCYRLNAGPVGTHSVRIWFVGKVPTEVDPRPGRWVPRVGDNIDSLTFVGPGAASVQLTGHVHYFVREGRAEVDREG